MAFLSTGSSVRRPVKCFSAGDVLLLVLKSPVCRFTPVILIPTLAPLGSDHFKNEANGLKGQVVLDEGVYVGLYNKNMTGEVSEEVVLPKER